VDDQNPASNELIVVGSQTPALSFSLSTPAPVEISDCWNKIGVSGDGTCAELKKFVHCRNCPVYSTAGALLLDRSPPDGYRRDWTEFFSREKKRVTPGRMSAVIFRIGAEWLALRTRTFQEVVERRMIHSLPHRREGVVLGLVNVRGELLICVCLGRLLGIDYSFSDERRRALCDRLVVAEWQGSRLTFPVDEIHGIHRYHAEELKEAPATVAKADSSFTRGVLAWQNRMVGHLDEELLFSTLNRSLS